MTSQLPQVVIVSGGSEVVGLALADAANRSAIPYAVISLVPRSLLRKAPGCVAWVDLHPHLGSQRGLRDKFMDALSKLSKKAGQRLAILPTEDGSLRLLNEDRDEVLPFGEFSRARSLRMGGVDKAEVVALAERLKITEGLVPSMVLHEPDDALSALHAYGQDAVFKPALKPLDMDLSAMGAGGLKVVSVSHVHESPEQLLARLRKAWHMSERWIAQPRLKVGENLERSVCAVRNGAVRACQVVERAKHPRMGGTAYWVSTEQRRDLIPVATRLLDALDVLGICEMSYLPDAKGVSQLIEFNPRPWLQVDLVERAGFQIVSETIAALAGHRVNSQALQIARCDWLQPERAVLAALSGQLPFRQLKSMLSPSVVRSTVFAGYSTAVPGARGQFLSRLVRKLVGTR
jgi:predicted ATP-grasp superfamily ATP-dependent carboligase